MSRRNVAPAKKGDATLLAISGRKSLADNRLAKSRSRSGNRRRNRPYSDSIIAHQDRGAARRFGHSAAADLESRSVGASDGWRGRSRQGSPRTDDAGYTRHGGFRLPPAAWGMLKLLRTIKPTLLRLQVGWRARTHLQLRSLMGEPVGHGSELGRPNSTEPPILRTNDAQFSNALGASASRNVPATRRPNVPRGRAIEVD